MPVFCGGGCAGELERGFGKGVQSPAERIVG